MRLCGVCASPVEIGGECGLCAAFAKIVAQWDRNPKGEKPQALSAEHESPVPEGDAPGKHRA